ncbi:MAG: restriction endonuclease subunit S [Curvibacter sp.]|jgi:type I restriction enzyme S subunit
MTWAEIAISDLGRIVTGDTPPRKNPEYYGSAYPFIKPTDMTVGQRLTMTYEEGYSEDGFVKYRKKLIPAGSTAVVTIGSIGQKLTWLHADSFVNQAVNAVVPDRATFDSLYVYYLLKHNLNLVKQADTGASSGRENVSKSNFSALTVWACLDLNTQKQIAEVLDALDSSIETNQGRIALLEDAARRIYREWFVHLRFPGHESVPVNDGVPEGWLPGSAHDYISILSGGTPKTGVEHYWGGDIPFFTPKDSPDAFYVFDTEKALTESGLASCNSRLFAKDTTFITARGTVGKVALAQKPMAMNQSCYALVPKQDYDNLFLFAAIKDAVEHFKQVAVGGVFDAIVVDTFKVIPFVLPSAVVTHAFGKAVRPLFQQVETLLLQNKQLARARDLLLPKLMSGQLDVSGIRLPEELTA